MREHHIRQDFVCNGSTLSVIANDIFKSSPTVLEVIIVQEGPREFSIFTSPSIDEDEQSFLVVNHLSGCVVRFFDDVLGLPEEVIKPPRQRGRKGSGLTAGQRAKLRRLVEQGKIKHRWGDPWDLSEADLALLGNVK